MAENMVSTHVLDTVHGGAAVGVKVSFHKLDGESWKYISEGSTGDDGRCGGLITSSQFVEGIYKLIFDTGAYFKSKGSYCIFPMAEVVFECKSPLEKYHMPILVSSYSYTTYRGK